MPTRSTAKKKAVKRPTVRKTPRPAPLPRPVTAERKHAKTKLVRDSFTMPDGEYAVIEQLKRRALRLAHPAKKSELLRAGIKALAALDDAKLRAALAAVPAIKTGRPKGGKGTKGKKAGKTAVRAEAKARAGKR